MNSSPAPDFQAILITCSFSGDLELCRLLCESVDRFVPDTIGHILYVPAGDVPLFASLASARREIRTQESLLPRWFWKAPMPGPAWRARLRLPRRNLYITPHSLPVRGWIAQQIMKIAATAQAAAEIIVHVDSDNVFIRSMSEERLTSGGKVRLYRDPVMVDQATHRLWHAAAGKLLGLASSEYYGAEYIDQIVVWKRSVLLAMIERIEAVSSSDWRTTLARTPQFAEYILYGIYADKIAGLAQAGLFADSRSLCLARWVGAIENEADADAFVESIQPWHTACLIQSTIDMPAEERRSLLKRAATIAATQDRAAHVEQMTS